MRWGDVKGKLLLDAALVWSVEPEYGVQSGGWMDIYLPQRCVVIETKRTGEADPDSVRNTDTGETQFEQCERYVQAEWERDRARLDLNGLGDLPWRAILTDGRVWWMWQWEIMSEGDLSAAKRTVAEQRYTRKSVEALVEWLRSDVFSQVIGKPWTPRHPAQIFEPLRETLRDEIYPNLKDDAGTRTKRDLWLDVLRSSGCAPPGELERRLEGTSYFTTTEGNGLTSEGRWGIRPRRSTLSIATRYPAWLPVTRWDPWSNQYVTILGRSIPLWISLS